MKCFKPVCIAIILFLSYTTAPLYAQNSSQNLSSINVNDLSDAQIRQLLQQGQASGLTDAQLIQQAENRGMSPDQAQFLQKRINDIRRNAGSSQMSDDTAQQSGRRLNYQQDTTRDSVNFSKRHVVMFQDLQPKIFGASLFRNKNLTFEPNLRLSTPLNYIIGPDDQLVVNIFGNSLANWKLNVSPEGNINLPGIGMINVTGKTISQATAAIRAKLVKNNYAIGKGTELQVTLGNIRSIKVTLIGELVKPGSYTLPSLATVFNALYAAGGPNDNGSFRRIEIIRDDRLIKTLDIYDFLLKGDQKDNISLQDQDIIRVPTYGVRVNMQGEVKTPALFEVIPGETLRDVIRFAGGFTDQAYTALIKVSQISDQQRRITDVPEADYGNYIPLRGDKYQVERILNRYENRVFIAGAVFRPGEYQLSKGLTAAQLIKKAAGLKEDAFPGRASILRLNIDNSRAEISFSLRDVMSGAAADIPLQREDSLVVSSIFDLRDKYSVSIKGEVRKPGQFAYVDSMSVADLIVDAGGFAEGASAKRIEVSRRIFDSDPRVKNSRVAKVYNVDIGADLKAGEGNFVLKPFDIVSIYSLPGYEIQKTVKVEGEVLYPGYYTIQKKDEKISDIISRAGGLTASADVDGSTLKRDNSAVLGVDKTKVDTVALNKERLDRLKRLQLSYRDSSTTDTVLFRNNYVGIDLRTILRKPGSNDDLILENGDLIRVPKQQQIVRINGEVLYPSAVVYSPGKSFRAYVLNAGGFSPNALKGGAYVVYPNGTVSGTHKFLFFNVHPAVKPGSEIYVPKHPPKRPLTLTEVIGLSSGLASIAAIILGIISLKK